MHCCLGVCTACLGLSRSALLTLDVLGASIRLRTDVDTLVEYAISVFVLFPFMFPFRFHFRFVSVSSSVSISCPSPFRFCFVSVPFPFRFGSQAHIVTIPFPLLSRSWFRFCFVSDAVAAVAAALVADVAAAVAAAVALAIAVVAADVAAVVPAAQAVAAAAACCSSYCCFCCFSLLLLFNVSAWHYDSIDIMWFCNQLPFLLAFPGLISQNPSRMHDFAWIPVILCDFVANGCLCLLSRFQPDLPESFQNA